ncbi:MAG: hypothetical protein AAFX99_05245 [Myxococcota bacterium]
MSPRHLLGLLALLSLGSAVACTEGNTLEGSLGNFYDTEYDSVRARLYPTEVTIEYARDNGQVPVRVTLRYQDVPPPTGRYDLLSLGDVTGRSGDNDMPPLVSGFVEFDSLGTTEGSEVVGSFEATFQTGDDTSGLRGTFDTTLEVIPEVGGVERSDWPPGQSCETAIDASERGTFLGTLYPTISDVLTTSCASSGSPDQILAFEQTEEGRLTIDYILDPNVSATLIAQECGLTGEVVSCLRDGRGRFREDVDAGMYFIVVEGEGNWEFTLEP